MKARGSTPELHGILADLRLVEASGIPGVAVECVDIRKNTLAKAASWASSHAHVRKRGEQTGLDTLVVHAVNDGH